MTFPAVSFAAATMFPCLRNVVSHQLASDLWRLSQYPESIPSLFRSIALPTLACSVSQKERKKRKVSADVDASNLWSGVLVVLAPASFVPRSDLESCAGGMGSGCCPRPGHERLVEIVGGSMQIRTHRRAPFHSCGKVQRTR